MGIGKFLPRLRQVLLSLLGKLILLHLFLVPLHAILGLPYFLYGLRNGLAHIALLCPDLLAGQRLRIAIDLDDEPL